LGFYLHAQPTETEQAERASVRIVRSIPALWLVGTVLIAGYICAHSIKLWRTVKRERPITDQKILDLLEDCKMQMRIETILAVVVSDRVKSPALFGFVRPRLLLPQGMLETYGLEELRYVFIHELAHLKQRDIYLGWLMALLHVAHWFNPLMWFAFSRIRVDREIACDRLAISTMEPDEPHKYGRTIVSLLESFSQPRYLPSVAGILEDSCQVERRIKMIADYKKTSRKSWAGAMLLVAALSCIVLTNAYVAKADFVFGAPANLGPTINTSSGDAGPSISSDGLELYMDSDRPGGYGGWDLWIATRPTTNDPWGEPVNLGPSFNTSTHEAAPSISANGLELYYSSLQSGSPDTWVATRATISDPWAEPVKLGPAVNSSSDDMGPSISADGLELYFASTRPGGLGRFDLWVTKRETIDDPWGEAVHLGPTVNSSVGDNSPCISPDGLMLFFESKRPGGYGDYDIWVTRRTTTDDVWGTPVNLCPTINSPLKEYIPCISPDGRELYYIVVNHPDGFGGYDIWQVSILPIVDFNGDGIVDSIDVAMMVDYWHTDEPLYDIAPMPFGDGIVDDKDVLLILEYLTPREVDPNDVTP
jgi:beta-lactamase regulating signal transducer with metallopeptidase domain/Tol biopolymer transport system component